MTSTCMKESSEVSLKFTQCDHQKTRKRWKYGFGKILKIFSPPLLSAICTELYHIKNLNPLNQIQSQRFITSIVSSKVCVDKLNQAFSNNQYSWKKSAFQLKVITLERWQKILGYLGHHIKVSYVITREFSKYRRNWEVNWNQLQAWQSWWSMHSGHGKMTHDIVRCSTPYQIPFPSLPFFPIYFPLKIVFLWIELSSYTEVIIFLWILI